ncbi:MAG TPA: hypothetical protein ENK91_02445 [Bacteroidetes bacterium]|nr:hypothetical protein [Bacteroidota bacterium]
MKRILFYFTIVFFLSSCVSLKLSDIRPVGKLNNLLPALTPHVDIKSFENTYLGLSAALIESHPIYYGNDVWGADIVETYAYPDVDPRIQDAVSIFIKDVKENMTNPLGEKRGDILCRITYGDVGRKGLGWFYLSTITGFIPNLVGFPLMSTKATIELEVQIFDNDKNLIGRYVADCENTKYIALYWGSSYPDAARKANAAAFKCAMVKIKRQIQQDAPKLIAQLSKAN